MQGKVAFWTGSQEHGLEKSRDGLTWSAASTDTTNSLLFILLVAEYGRRLWRVLGSQWLVLWLGEKTTLLPDPGDPRVSLIAITSLTSDTGERASI